MNRSCGRPIARTASSLPISVIIDSKLTLPGSDLINPRTVTPTASPSPSFASSSLVAAIRASNRALAGPPTRSQIRAVQVCSAVRNAERTIRCTRPTFGASIRSLRN